MFGSIGGTELLVILVIALLVFGPRKLPELGRTIGKTLAEFRRATYDFRNTLDREIETEETRRPSPPAGAPPPSPSGAGPAGKPEKADPASPVARSTGEPDVAASPVPETGPAGEPGDAASPLPETGPAGEPGDEPSRG